MELSRHQLTPLYYQLRTRLIEEILSGTDGRLPTEHELCKQFAMSRPPVTRAVSELAAEGVVPRRRRHGTFVNPHWLARRADSAEVRVMVPDDAGWAEHLRAVAPPGMPPSIAETDVSDPLPAALRGPPTASALAVPRRAAPGCGDNARTAHLPEEQENRCMTTAS